MRLVVAVVCAIAINLTASGAPARASESSPTPHASVAPTQAVVPEVPTADFKELCSGHVTGAPKADGGPGAHIEWTAYSSRSTTDGLAKRHAAKLTGGSHEPHETCDLWRFNDGAHHLWELCPVAVKGPASECAAPPGTASILVVSTLVDGD